MKINDDDDLNFPLLLYSNHRVFIKMKEMDKSSSSSLVILYIMSSDLITPQGLNCSALASNTEPKYEDILAMTQTILKQLGYETCYLANGQSLFSTSNTSTSTNATGDLTATPQKCQLIFELAELLLVNIRTLTCAMLSIAKPINTTSIEQSMDICIADAKICCDNFNVSQLTNLNVIESNDIPNLHMDEFLQQCIHKLSTFLEMGNNINGDGNAIMDYIDLPTMYTSAISIINNAFLSQSMCIRILQGSCLTGSSCTFSQNAAIHIVSQNIIIDQTKTLLAIPQVQSALVKKATTTTTTGTSSMAPQVDTQASKTIKQIQRTWIFYVLLIVTVLSSVFAIGGSVGYIVQGSILHRFLFAIVGLVMMTTLYVRIGLVHRQVSTQVVNLSCCDQPLAKSSLTITCPACQKSFVST
jgi:hypothetical protein